MNKHYYQGIDGLIVDETERCPLTTTVSKTSAGALELMEINCLSNPDEFLFSMIDNKGVVKQVVLHKSKPQDFEKSEQIVLIGKMKDGNFHANDILMKCPSKYNEAKQVN